MKCSHNPAQHFPLSQQDDDEHGHFSYIYDRRMLAGKPEDLFDQISEPIQAGLELRLGGDFGRVSQDKSISIHPALVEADVCRLPRNRCQGVRTIVIHSTWKHKDSSDNSKQSAAHLHRVGAQHGKTAARPLRHLPRPDAVPERSRLQLERLMRMRSGLASLLLSLRGISRLQSMRARLVRG